MAMRRRSWKPRCVPGWLLTSGSTLGIDVGGGWSWPVYGVPRMATRSAIPLGIVWAAPSFSLPRQSTIYNPVARLCGAAWPGTRVGIDVSGSLGPDQHPDRNRGHPEAGKLDHHAGFFNSGTGGTSGFRNVGPGGPLERAGISKALRTAQRQFGLAQSGTSTLGLATRTTFTPASVTPTTNSPASCAAPQVGRYSTSASPTAAYALKPRRLQRGVAERR